MPEPMSEETYEPWEIAFRDQGGENLWLNEKRIEADYAYRTLRVWFHAGYDIGVAERQQEVEREVERLRERLQRIADTTVLEPWGAFVPSGDDGIDVREFARISAKPFLKGDE